MEEYDEQWWRASFEQYVLKQEHAARLRRGEAPTAVPLEPSECETIVRALEDGSADWYDVRRRLIATLGDHRLWRTKEWKELRTRLIKSSCEQCGSETGPFTLHHLVASLTLTDFARKLRRELFSEFRTQMEHSDAIQAIEEQLGPDGEARLGCSFCGGTNLRERMRNRASHAAKARFVCETQRNGKVCKREFEYPVMLQPLRVFTPAFQRYRMIQEGFAALYRSREQDLYRNAAALAVRQFARYMAGDDTATFCKKCAYLWDQKGMRLCQKCGKGWHSHDFTQCADCAPSAELVLCKVCGKKRHPPRYSSCYACHHEPTSDSRGSSEPL